MWFKVRIRNKVYKLYLDGVSIEYIAVFLNLTFDDVNEIIDFMNEIHN